MKSSLHDALAMFSLGVVCIQGCGGDETEPGASAGGAGQGATGGGATGGMGAASPGGAAGDAGTGASAGRGTGGTAASGGVLATGGGAGQGGAGGATPGGDLTPPIRATFFYPWFPETWGKANDPFTNYTPVDGLYDSSDSAVIERQLKQMRYAHIQAAIASWWGKGSKTDGRIAGLLDLSRQLALKDGGTMVRFSLYIEAEGDAVPWGSVNPTVEQIGMDLQTIYQSYASHPAFLHIAGKPVLFTWADGADDCNSSERWTAANDAFEQATGKRFYLVLKLFSGFKDCPKQPDSWHQYGPASAYHEHLPYSAVVSPGFWLKGDGSPTLDRDTTRFQADVQKMNTAQATFKLITTFNEWGEGTAVEPAQEWSSASGYGSYLDILHDAAP